MRYKYCPVCQKNHYNQRPAKEGSLREVAYGSSANHTLYRCIDCGALLDLSNIPHRWILTRSATVIS